MVDQAHMKCTIGGSGHSGSTAHIQYRVSLDPETMELKNVSKGGVLPKRKQRVQPKYDQECRGCYGVACPTNEITGIREPTMMETWDYTCKQLHSAKGSDAEMQQINNKYGQRAGWKGKDAVGWRPFKDSVDTFQARYGEEKTKEYGQQQWEKELKATPLWSKHADIHDMVRHIIKEGNQIFANSRHKQHWLIHHNHLSILWENQTLQWLKTLWCPTPDQPNRSWFDRFIKLEGSFNDEAPKRYKNNLMGDSPELQALDNHLFSDIKELVARNIAFSFHLSEEDKKKYSASTPKRLYSAIQRTIEKDAHCLRGSLMTWNK
jgi:hypothetical protein